MSDQLFKVTSRRRPLTEINLLSSNNGGALTKTALKKAALTKTALTKAALN
jgi:hypothetical protein